MMLSRTYLLARNANREVPCVAVSFLGQPARTLFLTPHVRHPATDYHHAAPTNWAMQDPQVHLSPLHVHHTSTLNAHSRRRAHTSTQNMCARRLLKIMYVVETRIGFMTSFPRTPKHTPTHTIHSLSQRPMYTAPVSKLIAPSYNTHTPTACTRARDRSRLEKIFVATLEGVAFCFPASRKEVLLSGALCIR